MIHEAYEGLTLADTFRQADAQERPLDPTEWESPSVENIKKVAEVMESLAREKWQWPVLRSISLERRIQLTLKINHALGHQLEEWRISRGWEFTDVPSQKG